MLEGRKRDPAYPCTWRLFTLGTSSREVADITRWIPARSAQFVRCKRPPLSVRGGGGVFASLVGDWLCVGCFIWRRGFGREMCARVDSGGERVFWEKGGGMGREVELS